MSFHIQQQFSIHYFQEQSDVKCRKAYRKYNINFNYGEFAIIKSQAGLNNYKLSVKDWIEKTNAIGLKATAGRYGGTYAHADIAFEFECG